MKRILRVIVCRSHDASPDTSWVGEYTDTPGPVDRTIDRRERGEMDRGEYRYFVAANSATDTGVAESVERDYQRMESILGGDIEFLGIRAKADVQLTGNVVQEITSGGLWGIESDSDSLYLKEIESDELGELHAELVAIGFTDAQVNAAFADVERSGP